MGIEEEIATLKKIVNDQQQEIDKLTTEMTQLRSKVNTINSQACCYVL